MSAPIGSPGRDDGLAFDQLGGEFGLALVVLATLAGAYLFYRAMPAYSGAEKLPGLSAEVRVWRDAYGVAAHLRRLDG